MFVNWLNGTGPVNNLKYLCGVTDLIKEYESLYELQTFFEDGFDPRMKQVEVLVWPHRHCRRAQELVRGE